MHNHRAEIVKIALEVQNFRSLDLMRHRTLLDSARLESDRFNALQCQNQDLRKR